MISPTLLALCCIVYGFQFIIVWFILFVGGDDDYKYRTKTQFFLSLIPFYFVIRLLFNIPNMIKYVIKKIKELK